MKIKEAKKNNFLVVDILIFIKRKIMDLRKFPNIRTIFLLCLSLPSILCNEVDVSSQITLKPSLTDTKIIFLAPCEICASGIGSHKQLGSPGRHKSVLVQLSSCSKRSVNLPLS